MKSTLDQVIEEAFQILSESQKKQLQMLPKQELILTHFGLGMFYRNELKL